MRRGLLPLSRPSRTAERQTTDRKVGAVATFPSTHTGSERIQSDAERNGSTPDPAGLADAVGRVIESDPTLALRRCPSSRRPTSGRGRRDDGYGEAWDARAARLRVRRCELRSDSQSRASFAASHPFASGAEAEVSGSCPSSGGEAQMMHKRPPEGRALVETCTSGAIKSVSCSSRCTRPLPGRPPTPATMRSRTSQSSRQHTAGLRWIDRMAPMRRAARADPGW